MWRHIARSSRRRVVQVAVRLLLPIPMSVGADRGGSGGGVKCAERDRYRWNAKRLMPIEENTQRKESARLGRRKNGTNDVKHGEKMVHKFWYHSCPARKWTYGYSQKWPARRGKITLPVTACVAGAAIAAGRASKLFSGVELRATEIEQEKYKTLKNLKTKLNKLKKITKPKADWKLSKLKLLGKTHANTADFNTKLLPKLKHMRTVRTRIKNKKICKSNGLMFCSARKNDFMAFWNGMVIVTFSR